MTPPVLDYGNMLAPRVGDGGIDPGRLGGDLAARFRTAFAKAFKFFIGV